MPRTLIRNAYVISMDSQRRCFENGDVLVENDRIVAVGKVADSKMTEETELIDAAGCIVLPGLANTHVHTSQQLERGLADDVDLLTWLHKRTWPFESRLTEEDSYVSSLACGVELIRSGVTRFAEAGGQHVNGMGRAVSELGVRAALCQSTMDCGKGLAEGWVLSTQECLDRQTALFDRWHGEADGRLSVWFGLRTIFNCSDELIVRSKELADARGVGLHMHVAEVREEVEFCRETRGATTVEHLERLGALGPNLMAVHTVWLTDNEIGLFAKRGVKVSHNPAAAMRVLGFAPIAEMLDAGVCVTLGTDGAPCNNRMDMIAEMRLAGLIHKGRKLDPTVVPAESVVEMATTNGAQALLAGDETGSLEPGKKADIVVIRPDSAGTLPVHSPVSALVYAMSSSEVESVMCDGQWLLRDGEVLCVDEQAVLEEAKDRAGSLRRRSGIELPKRWPVTVVR